MISTAAGTDIGTESNPDHRLTLCIVPETNPSVDTGPRREDVGLTYACDFLMPFGGNHPSMS